MVDTDRIVASVLRRRDILKASAALGLGAVLPFGGTLRARAAGIPTCVNSIRSLSNPYHATWNKGGAAFAKSVGADYVTLVTEGNSEKGVADIKAILSKTGGNCVINVDPNDGPDARPIVSRPARRRGPMWSRSGTSPQTFTPGITTRITSPTSRSVACRTLRPWLTL